MEVSLPLTLMGD